MDNSKGITINLAAPILLTAIGGTLGYVRSKQKGGSTAGGIFLGAVGGFAASFVIGLGLDLLPKVDLTK